MSFDDCEAAPSVRRQPRRVFLHVGSPKTGTTFLQHILWSQRDVAREQGLLLPLGSFFDHYLASIDVRELSYEPRYPARAIGMWTEMVEEGLRWPGNVLVSHELLAAVTAEQAVTAVTSWGNRDVHVVVTARDLARQIPAEWQEHVKHRSATTLAEFVEHLKARTPPSAWFWTVQDYADVCRRWSSAVPVENIHLVTVPPQGAPLEALWNRFALVLELDPAAFDLDRSRTNSSLGAEQVELLRRINRALGERLTRPGAYPGIVKDFFAQQVLAGRRGAPVALSEEDHAFARERTAPLVQELRDLRVNIVGDLTELVPPQAGRQGDMGATVRPEDLAPQALLQESVEALCTVLERVGKEAHSVAEVDHLRTQLRDTRAEMSELRVGYDLLRQQHENLRRDVQSHPVRALLIAMSERHPRVQRLRVAYRQVKRRLRLLHDRNRT